MIRRFILPAICAFLALVSLWVGAWLVHVCPPWAEFAALTTAVGSVAIFTVACIGSSTHVAAKLEEEAKERERSE